MSLLRILLDYDGVVLRNRRALHYQTSASARFFRKITSRPLVECARLNERLYPIHGHTVLVLRREFGASVTLKDYNDFVYSEQVLKNCPSLSQTADTVAAFEEVDRLVQVCKQQGLPVCVFTNAPPEWVRYTALGEARKLPIIHPDGNLDLLKPRAAAFSRINELFDSTEKFILIDDSHANCDAALRKGGRRWRSVVFEKDLTFTLQKYLANLSI